METYRKSWKQTLSTSKELSESLTSPTSKRRLPPPGPVTVIYLKRHAEQEHELHHQEVLLKKGELKVQQ